MKFSQMTLVLPRSIFYHSSKWIQYDVPIENMIDSENTFIVWESGTRNDENPMNIKCESSYDIVNTYVVISELRLDLEVRSYVKLVIFESVIQYDDDERISFF